MPNRYLLAYVYNNTIAYVAVVRFDTTSCAQSDNPRDFLSSVDL